MAGGSSSEASASSAISITKSIGPEPGFGVAVVVGVEEGAEVEGGAFTVTPFEGRWEGPLPFATPFVLATDAGAGAGAGGEGDATGMPGIGVTPGGLGTGRGWTPFVLVGWVGWVVWVAGGCWVSGLGKGCEPSLRAPPTPGGGLGSMAAGFLTREKMLMPPPSNNRYRRDRTEA